MPHPLRQRILITGASAGLGEGMARRFAGMGRPQFLLQSLKPVDAAGREGQVAAQAGEPAGHALAEAGARAADQDALATGVRHRVRMPNR
jgi:NAD(P)-dependent dehydrogenase (short-subunit alcohol dehydrogenase family)